ncbi:MAG: AEC family transporter [Christensenellales bacterium]|jgi:predicted permease
MAGVLGGVQAVLAILILVAAGFFLSRRGWFDEGGGQLVRRLVVQFSTPVLLCYNMVDYFTRQDLLEAGYALLSPIVSILALVGVAKLLCPLLRIEQRRRGVFCCMFAFSNTIFIGVPVNVALFGEQSVPFVLVYFIGNTLLFWTLGIRMMQRDGATGPSAGGWREGLKSLLSPPILGALAGVALVMLQVKLPDFALSSMKYIGNLTTPLALLYSGMLLERMGVKHIRYQKGMGAVLVGRFVLSPLLTLAMTFALGLPALIQKVFLIQASLPIMSQTTILAAACGADEDYAAVGFALTNLVCMLMLPVMAAATSLLPG